MFIRQGALSATDVSVFFKENDLINMYTEMYSKIGLHFALWYYKNVDKLLNKASDLDNLMSIWAKSFAFVGQQVGAQRVTLVSGTAKNTLIAVTQKLMSDPAFMNQGEKVKAKMLKTQFNRYSTYQAKRLVRTEATNAANSATIASAQTVFEGKDLIKRWHTIMDGRERDSHNAVNGKEVSNTGKFSVGGQFLKWPGDPEGEASNVINCRCGVSVFPKPNAQTTGENITDIGFGVAQAQVQSAISEALITPEVLTTIVAETAVIESNSKTIKEAEQWAVDNGIAKTVNYKGLTLDTANEINKTMKMVFNDWALEPLDFINNGSRKLGSANGQLIRYNASKLKQDELDRLWSSSVANYKERTQKRVNHWEAFGNKIPPDYLKDAKESLNYSRYHVHISRNDMRSDLFIHELGHTIEDQLLGLINRALVQSRFGKFENGIMEFSSKTKAIRDEYIAIYKNIKKEDLYKISNYGSTDIDEVFAESLVMYYREPQNMPTVLKNFFDKLKIYARK
jgi:hypothetical protein